MKIKLSDVQEQIEAWKVAKLAEVDAAYNLWRLVLELIGSGSSATVQDVDGIKSVVIPVKEET